VRPRAVKLVLHFHKAKSLGAARVAIGEAWNAFPRRVATSSGLRPTRTALYVQRGRFTSTESTSGTSSPAWIGSGFDVARIGLLEIEEGKLRPLSRDSGAFSCNPSRIFVRDGVGNTLTVNNGLPIKPKQGSTEFWTELGIQVGSLI
jgi:hypothetical protein